MKLKRKHLNELNSTILRLVASINDADTADTSGELELAETRRGVYIEDLIAWVDTMQRRRIIDKMRKQQQVTAPVGETHSSEAAA